MNIIESIMFLLVYFCSGVSVLLIVVGVVMFFSPTIRQEIINDFNKKPTPNKKPLVVSVTDKDVIINCPSCNCCNPVKPLNIKCWNCKSPITFYHSEGEW